MPTVCPYCDVELVLYAQMIESGKSSHEDYVFRCLASNKHEFLYSGVRDTHKMMQKEVVSNFIGALEEFSELSREELLNMIYDAEEEGRKYLKI
ncbi:MAG: hypothetical protein GOV02_01250 [Candidatus Aenigmarchaeota archaeon]|nr:hypothetical protein [Candidatus Aenigmarchaeota archaeon]